MLLPSWSFISYNCNISIDSFTSGVILSYTWEFGSFGQLTYTMVYAYKKSRLLGFDRILCKEICFMQSHRYLWHITFSNYHPNSTLKVERVNISSMQNGSTHIYTWSRRKLGKNDRLCLLRGTSPMTEAR